MVQNQVELQDEPVKNRTNMMSQSKLKGINQIELQDKTTGRSKDECDVQCKESEPSVQEQHGPICWQKSS